jgi:hypothetical protein
MPGPTATTAAPARKARTLAQVYRHFGAADAAGASPLYQRVAVALSESGEAALRRTVAWVSVEGVGVAPAIPTFGDRRASGHSIIGLALFGQSAVRIEAAGRCWSRGRFLTWLADS